MADWNNYRTDRNTRTQKQKRLSENVESLSERRRYKKREDNEERIRQSTSWRREKPDSSRTKGYTAMMSPHAGTVGLRNGLAI